MTCSCDKYYDHNKLITISDDLKKAKIIKCRAQSLVNELAKLLEQNAVKLSDSVASKVEIERRSLLTHKREELASDILSTKEKIKTCKITLKSNHASNPGKLQEKIVELTNDVEKMCSVSEKELLGL